MSRLLCIGDLNADVAIHPEGALVAGGDVPGSVTMSAGGSAANVAAEAARLATATRFVGVVGDDALGRVLVDDLVALGVDACPIVRSGAPTRSIAAVVGPDGDRSMVSDLATPMTLTVDDVDTAWFNGAGWLHLTAYTWFPEGGPAVFGHLISTAEEHGVAWSVDPSSAHMLASVRGARLAADSFAGAAVLFPNADEATVLADDDDPRRAALRLLDLADTVVVTAGDSGVTVVGRGREAFDVPAHPAVVVNTLGCGDAFAGGFLVARLAGLDDRACAQRGLSSAARVLGLTGAR